MPNLFGGRRIDLSYLDVQDLWGVEMAIWRPGPAKGLARTRELGKSECGAVENALAQQPNVHCGQAYASRPNEDIGAWEAGMPPFVVGVKFDVLLKNGEQRRVERNQALDWANLFFTDCTHPMQNAFCAPDSVVKWRPASLVPRDCSQAGQQTTKPGWWREMTPEDKLRIKAECDGAIHSRSAHFSDDLGDVRPDLDQLLQQDGVDLRQT